MTDDVRRRCAAIAAHWYAADIADHACRDQHIRTDEQTAEFGRRISQRLSAAVEDGDLDLDAAQHIVSDLQLPPLDVDFSVRLLVPITVAVHANGPDAAEDRARERIEVLLDGHDDAYIDPRRSPSNTFAARAARGPIPAPTPHPVQPDHCGQQSRLRIVGTQR